MESRNHVKTGRYRKALRVGKSSFIVMKNMEHLINLIISLFMIGIGFLVRTFPDLISGYTSMPKEKK
jgi:hypothetical protein